MEDIIDFFENGMFVSMKRQIEEDYEDIFISEFFRKLVFLFLVGVISNKTFFNFFFREVDNNYRNLYDFFSILILISDEDSIW